MKEDAPRLLLISQWPKVRNAEFELIEKIRKTGFDIAVVDFLGRDVATGNNLNDATLRDRYDFALSFHYDTPKFLDLPTFLWVANPLGYMHLRPDYRAAILDNLRAYDDYLYNGAPLLKQHVRQVVGSEWRDSGLHFYAATSREALQAPERQVADVARAARIFYCGINWERIEDRQGRAHGLLEHLQERNAADFFGPEKLEGFSTWQGFPSYRGEIPFDGVSLARSMREYGAVLALSSPAHLKSGTSSSRVFEGFAAGVPVISDHNPHVESLFGDLVWYFSGATDGERADSILAIRDEILASPRQAIERVRQAQALIAEKYCFEFTLAAAARTARRWHSRTVGAIAATADAELPAIDVFLFRHDAYPIPDAHHGVPLSQSRQRAGKPAGRARRGARQAADVHAEMAAKRSRLVAAGTSDMKWGKGSNGSTWMRIRAGQGLVRTHAGREVRATSCTRRPRVFGLFHRRGLPPSRLFHAPA
jgi:hypothetical protein